MDEFRPYIERYRTCASSVEVSEMQEKIMRELEESYNQSRSEDSRFFHFFCVANYASINN